MNVHSNKDTIILFAESKVNNRPDGTYKISNNIKWIGNKNTMKQKGLMPEAQGGKRGGKREKTFSLTLSTFAWRLKNHLG